MEPFRYERPTTLEDAVRLAAEEGAMVYAGGTTMLDLMKLGVYRPATVVDVTRLEVPAMRRIAVEGGTLRLGALVSMNDAAEDETVIARAPVLSESLWLAASQQLRHMATLGGNVMQRTRDPYFRDPRWLELTDAAAPAAGGDGAAYGVTPYGDGRLTAVRQPTRLSAVLGTTEDDTASYPGDWAQSLVAFDARVEAEGPDGAREMPFEELHVRPADKRHEGEYVRLAPGEIITGFTVPLTPALERSIYIKARDRESYAFANASVALGLEMEADGETVREAHLGLGGVATVPWRAREAEAALRGERLTEENARAAGEAAFAAAVTHEAQRLQGAARDQRDRARVHDPQEVGGVEMAGTYDVTGGVNLAPVGAPVRRYESRAKVTGEARYAADEPMAGTLHAALAVTPHARGRITGIDAARAEAVPGVRLVLTHLNMPDLTRAEVYTKGGAAQNSIRSLGGPQVHYAGQMVGLVVAETPEAARLGADRLRVDVAPEPAAASMHGPDAPEPEPLPTDAYEPIEKGDLEAALAEADASVEAEYRTPHQHHNPIELYFASAEWRDGVLIANVPSQWVAGMRAGLSTVFDLPASHVRVRSAYVGGGFGSKATLNDYVTATAAAARMAGAPVKLYVSRHQMFSVASHRPQSTHRMRVAMKDGRLTAIDHAQDSQTSRIDTFFLPGTEQTSRLYDWSAIRTAERIVRTDTNTPGFMRAPAETPALFALESAVDELAVEAGLDPVELRLASDAPDAEPVDGLPWTSRSLAECLRRGAEAFGWADRPPEARAQRRGDWLFGQGVASAIYPAYTRPATARLRLAADGGCLVRGAAHELGGGTATIVRQIVAAELGLPPDSIRVELGDSDYAVNGVAGGSTQTASFGSAVLDACRRIRSELTGAATGEGQSLSGADPAAIRFAEASLIASDGRSTPLADAFAAVPFGVLEVTGAWTPEASGNTSTREFYRSGAAKQVGFVTETHARAAFGAQFVEVAVHALTGEVRVPRMLGAFAFGRVLNERTARHQLTGGMIWGVGSVLHEATEMDRRHARFVNSDLGEYLIPVNADVPRVEALIVEELDEHVSPLGAKGVGELGITGVNAAVANAVHHATGRRLREVPIRMEHLLEA